MHSVTCIHCGNSFIFDPKRIWTSPGDAPKDQPVTIQCEKCKQWLSVTIGAGDKTAAK